MFHSIQVQRLLISNNEPSDSQSFTQKPAPWRPAQPYLGPDILYHPVSVKRRLVWLQQYPRVSFSHQLTHSGRGVCRAKQKIFVLRQSSPCLHLYFGPQKKTKKGYGKGSKPQNKKQHGENQNRISNQENILHSSYQQALT